MNIVKQLEESGILDAIEAASRVESNQIVAAESRNEELINIVNQSIDEAFEIAYDFHKKSKGFILK